MSSSKTDQLETLNFKLPTFATETVSCRKLPHLERHFTASEVVRDIVIGMSDGLTVPFALAAGLTGAVHTTRSL